jgi:hypothetical protein
MYHKKIKIPLFESSFNFVIVQNNLEYKYIYAAENMFCYSIEEDYENQLERIGFFETIKNDNNMRIDTVCINYHNIKDEKDLWDTISHEIFHYVFHLFNNIIGIPCKTSSEEVYAYTTGYILGEIYECINEFKKEKEEFIDDIDYIIDNYKDISVYDLINKLMISTLDGPYLASTMLVKLREGMDINLIKEDIIEIFKENGN